MRIELQSITKSYRGRSVLSETSLSIPDSQMTALIGPSGSGKSTLLKIIAGLEAPDSGRVFFDSDDVTSVPVRYRNIGFCFQDYAPFQHMSVFDNVAYGLKVRKAPKEVIATEVTALLKRTGLDQHAAHRPHELSGGQQQRMSLARALAIKPRVLLLDEPFAALDAQVRHDLRGWVHDLQRELGITTILVTHDQSEAMEVADSLVVLNAGRIEQVGTPSSIYDSPATDFVRTFVGPTTIFRGSVVRPHQLRVAHSGPGELVVVDDIIVLGFEVRIHVVTNDGSRTWIQLSHEEALELGIRCGDQVVVSIRTLALKGGADEAPTKRPTKEHIS